jgi:hypothetical protein
MIGLDEYSGGRVGENSGPRSSFRFVVNEGASGIV